MSATAPPVGVLALGDEAALLKQIRALESAVKAVNAAELPTGAEYHVRPHACPLAQGPTAALLHYLLLLVSA